MALKAFAREHPVLMYFALTFAISFGGIIVLGAPYGMPAASGDFERHWFVVFLPLFAGPTTASLVMTGLVHGRAGLRELKSRLLRWRVRAGWYAVALLTVPALVLVTLAPLSLASHEFIPAILTADDKAGLVISGLIVAFVFGGLIEELGWTGFATPELRRRHGTLASGLVVGLLWATWHIFPTYWGSGDASGKLDLGLLAPPCIFYLGVLPAYRVLMVWAHDRTNSVLVAILMHGSLTASTKFILAPSAVGAPLSAYYVILTAVVWAVVAVVVVRDGGRLPRWLQWGWKHSRGVSSEQ